MNEKFFELLKLPQVRKIRDLDDPGTTLLHGNIIRRKPILKKLYADFYARIKKSIGDSLKGKSIVELGSGRGFIKEVIPGVITSDVIKLSNVNLNLSAVSLPFKDGSVDAFVMVNVLHHIHDAEKFFNEADRCLKDGGDIVMIEPASTFWGRLIWRLHYEAFDTKAGWRLDKARPLSVANGALPWIVFYRDRIRFSKEFPRLKILKLEPHTPFMYIASGGVLTTQLLPSFTYNALKALERALSCFNSSLGMFLTISLKKAPRV
ncbi:MAG: methyltransferase domain-containing protein [Candidatus Omnitrophica bacterium]|nr:methyltransferase domain-containing protein [Candidatus Omnitrophota bacterium]